MTASGRTLELRMEVVKDQALRELGVGSVGATAIFRTAVRRDWH